MPQIKLHGATINSAAIEEFYPVNTKHPDFGFLKFHHLQDTSGDYYLEASAHNKSETFMKFMPISKDTPVVPIHHDSFEPRNIHFGTEFSIK
ncbi:MAG TPA: hypothetical protein VM888_06605 [Chitinophagaceae bacterium]|nr:hypothetical protein [Chitinophagaceae bacterium]